MLRFFKSDSSSTTAQRTREILMPDQKFYTRIFTTTLNDKIIYIARRRLSDELRAPTFRSVQIAGKFLMENGRVALRKQFSNRKPDLRAETS
jgi:hypothetical protein